MAKMKAQKAKQDRRSDATELYGLSHLPDDVLSDLIKKRRPVVRNWIDRTDNKAPSIVRLGHPLANALSYMIDIYERVMDAPMRRRCLQKPPFCLILHLISPRRIKEKSAAHIR